jgi:hypothetical protein
VHVRLAVAEERAVYTLVGLEAERRTAAADLGFTNDGDVWHRHVARHDDDLEMAFDRFRAVAEELLDQAARRRPTPWADALEAVCDLAGDLDWWLTGSAALAVRGVEVDPRDVDLVTDVAGAHALATRLREHLVEPLSIAEEWVAARFGRAFLGARVEWVGGVSQTVDEAAETDFGPAAAGRLAEVAWRGRRLLVPPLELQLEVSRRRGLTGRVEAIERALASARPP